jgi:hypothetical protein
MQNLRRSFSFLSEANFSSMDLLIFLHSKTPCHISHPCLGTNASLCFGTVRGAPTSTGSFHQQFSLQPVCAYLRTRCFLLIFKATSTMFLACLHTEYYMSYKSQFISLSIVLTALVRFTNLNIPLEMNCLHSKTLYSPGVTFINPFSKVKYSTNKSTMLQDTPQLLNGGWPS